MYLELRVEFVGRIRISKQTMLSQLQRFMQIKLTLCLSYSGNYDDKSKEQIPVIEVYLVPLTEVIQCQSVGTSV